MPLKIFEEVGKDNILLSPFCHNLRLAISHMKLEAEFVGVTPKEMGNYQFKALPILKDDKRRIHTAFEIAKYLERNFPISPTIFGGEAGTYLAKFVNSYIEDGLYNYLLGFLKDDILNKLEEADREIFLSRILLINKSKKDNLLEFTRRLNPIRTTLKKQDFLFGERPGYVDFMVYGLFIWANSMTDLTLLNGRDSLNNWLLRVKKTIDQKMVA